MMSFYDGMLNLKPPLIKPGSGKRLFTKGQMLLIGQINILRDTLHLTLSQP